MLLSGDIVQGQGRKQSAYVPNGEDDGILITKNSPACYGRNSPMLSGGLSTTLAWRNCTLRSASQPEPIKSQILKSRNSVDSELTRKHFTESLATGPGYLKEVEI